ncbi:MAG: ABC transporter permease subunit [Myxococcales bacterium]|nr:ABC transporter permease subunit [Myxococcales bacterium]
MRNAWLLARRELGAYLKSPMGYVIVAIVLFVDGMLFNVWAIGSTPRLSSHVLKDFFAIATFMSMVSGVLLSMRLIAEEKQLGTLTLLLTSPIHDREIILGKFLSALIFFTGMTLLTIYMPALIFWHGKVSWGHIFGGYLGLVMLGALSISIGLFASSIARTQIVAAIAGGAIMTAVYLCYLGANVADPPVRSLMAFISPQKHLQWQTGVLHLRDVIYYVTGTYLFLLASTHMLQARRWR